MGQAKEPRRRENSLLGHYGPWAVVTGASNGIGRAAAEALAAYGFDLVLVARRGEALAELGRRLEEAHGVETRIAPADLALEAEVERVDRETRNLDVGLLFAAAGFGTSGPFARNALADELGMIDVNCRAVAQFAHVFANRLIPRRRGGIVLLSSLVAFQGVPRAANYAATKAFVQTLAEGLARELKPFGVDVLASAPGPVKSGFGARAGMAIASGQTPEEVARRTLAALGRRTTVRPGFLAKALAASLAPLPRALRVRAMERVMAGLTKPQADGVGFLGRREGTG